MGMYSMGYVYEGENPPEKCPQCGVPASKFKEQEADKIMGMPGMRLAWLRGSPEDIMMDLSQFPRANALRSSMYLAMYKRGPQGRLS